MGAAMAYSHEEPLLTSTPVVLGLFMVHATSVGVGMMPDDKSSCVLCVCLECLLDDL